MKKLIILLAVLFITIQLFGWDGFGQSRGTNFTQRWMALTSYLTLGNDANNTSGTINWIASDGDTGTMAIGTSDNFAVTGFTGGFDVDGAFTAGIVTSDGAIVGTTLNTGQGAYELYAMNQDVESTDAVTFATLDTGQGDNELYAMNQDVESTDDVTFNNLTLTGDITDDGTTLYIETVTVADEAEVTMPTGISGFGNIYIGDRQEWARISFKADGTVSLEMNSLNVLSTNTDGNLCVYQSGSGIKIKNHLGSELELSINISYYTP